MSDTQKPVEDQVLPGVWKDPATERLILDEISLDAPWALVERFSTLTRESGTEDERVAARYIAEQLRGWGVPHQVYEPKLFLSLPKTAAVQVTIPEVREVKATTPAFSVSTGGVAVTGDLVHVPTGYAKSTLQVFDVVDPAADQDLNGKIVLTEGYANPGKVKQFQDLGAAGIVCVNPGTYIHEGICTPIWGAPDLDNADRKPGIPVVAISRPDGKALEEQCRSGRVEISLSTELEEGWMGCPLVVAEIPGTIEPEKFVLLHGHIDSWYVGVGDNATGDATLLEIARVLWQHSDRLQRSVRLAWWPGHSTGRYAGSTWYVDNFALDIDENCIAHINCDSPGCRWATAYENVMWMSEAEELGRAAIRDATGKESTGARPLRAGDISFNNLGVSTFYMLTSSMPRTLLEKKGYYPVGGCGMNIEWHTPGDTLEIADRDILLQDIKVYALGVLRSANAPVYPLDFRKTAAEMAQTLKEYREAAGERFDLSQVTHLMEEVRQALETFYQEEVLTRLQGDPADRAVKHVNDVLRRVGRLLVGVSYSRSGKFKQDPALQIPAIPDLAPVRDLAAVETGSHEEQVLLTHLTRGRNRVVHDLREAKRELQVIR